MSRTALWAAAVFAFFLIRPAAVVQLRHQAARSDPSWASNPANGRYAVLTPQVTGLRYTDEALYAARVNQVRLHGVPYTPYWREFRGVKHWLHEFLPYYLLAGAAATVGGDLNVAWTLLAAAVAAGWFLLWFALLRAASGRDDAALVPALFMSLFPDAGFWLLDLNLDPATQWTRWSSVFFSQGAAALPHYHRLYSMHLSFLLVCLYLIALWRVTTSAKPRAGAAFLLGLGSLALAYTHSFEYALTMGAVAFFPLALQAAGAPAPSRRAAWLALGGGLAAAAVYVLVERALRAPGDVELLMGLAHAVPSRRFHPLTLVHLAVGAWMWRQARRDPGARVRAAWLLLAAAQASAFCWRNGELVFGMDIQFFHVLPMAGTLGAAGLLLSASRAAAGWKPWRKLAPALVAALFIVGATRELGAARAGYRALGLPADVQNAYAWLNQNAPKDALLLTLSARVNMEAPIYTGVKVEAAPLNAPVLVLFDLPAYDARVARLLKTLRADPERFVAARRLPPAERVALYEKLSRAVLARGEVDLDALEPALWYHNEPGTEPFEARRARLLTLAETAEPLDGPYYVWLDERDRGLLKETPEKRGLAPVFRSGSVSLYSIPR